MRKLGRRWAQLHRLVYLIVLFGVVHFWWLKQGKNDLSEPSIFAAQAYDAMRIVLEAIRKGATNSLAVYEQLVSGPDLPTLTGPAAFGPSGALNRRLFIIYVKNGKLVQLN